MTEVAPGILRISSDALPERERLPFFREVMGRTVVRLDFEPLVNGFHWNGAARTLPGLGLAIGDLDGIRLQRTRALIADGSDDIGLGVATNGYFVHSQLGREVTVRAGTAVLCSNADVGSQIIPVRTQAVALALPRKLLATMVPDLEDALARPLAPDTEALRLLTSYVGVIGEDRALSTPELQHLVVTHVHDLAALAIGASRDATQVAAGRGLRAARLRAIKADIVENLAAHDLSLGALARRHGISESYIRKLFDSEGTSFTQFVLGQRLARAHRTLVDPRAADRTIADIAFASGFNDLSYFNRAFRRAHRATPSDVRQTHRNRAS
jgi:AraC-like DNA-binding protein